MPFALLGFAVAVVLAVMLLVAGQPVFPPHVSTAIWNMPPGIGAFFGSILGLLGVAGAALIGFRNLIRAQEHQAQLARERDQALRAEEIKALAAALAGELRGARAACKYQLERLEWVKENLGEQLTWQVIAEIGLWQPVEPTIYRANAAKLGYLEPALVVAVSRSYSLLHGIGHFGEIALVPVEAIESLLIAAEASTQNSIKRIDGVLPQLDAVAGLPTVAEPQFEPWDRDSAGEGKTENPAPARDD